MVLLTQFKCFGSVQDGHCSLRTHHCNLSSRPCVVYVATEMFRTHYIVGTTKCLQSMCHMTSCDIPRLRERGTSG